MIPSRNQPAAIDLLGAARRSVLTALKRAGRATIPWLAKTLSISPEAVRQQLALLQRDGWVISDCGSEEEAEARTRGRPPAEYCLSRSADDLFPKRYADLLVSVLDSVTSEDGNESLTELLARVTDERVAELKPRVESLPLNRTMDALRSIYVEADPFTEVERRGRDFVLIERNCPYLSVAMERPEICSTTVNTLRRLTGCEVVRERRFQDGDGRCEFHVRTSRRSPAAKRRRFELEPPKTS
ncbi:MAG TPA: DNA-binding protein [Thermoanaerobaculia bacterium]|jgi:predicted ArsR family transcriptional regulator